MRAAGRRGAATGMVCDGPRGGDRIVAGFLSSPVRSENRLKRHAGQPKRYDRCARGYSSFCRCFAGRTRSLVPHLDMRCAAGEACPQQSAGKRTDHRLPRSQCGLSYQSLLPEVTRRRSAPLQSRSACHLCSECCHCGHTHAGKMDNVNVRSGSGAMSREGRSRRAAGGAQLGTGQHDAGVRVGCVSRIA